MATVTITTVGYGDVYPVTTNGRIAGVVLMFAGLGVLGVLAGALASFFGFGEADESLADESRTDEAGADESAPLAAAGDVRPPQALDVDELRRRLDELDRAAAKLRDQLR